MKRYNCGGGYAERSDVDKFLAEVGDLCRKHGLSIAHEDSHGAFVVRPFNEHDAKWLGDAQTDFAEVAEAAKDERAQSDDGDDS